MQLFNKGPFSFSYVSLLDQYESVSYGHHLFSAVILLPLAKTASSSLKLALWAEHTYALQIISLSEDQVRFKRSMLSLLHFIYYKNWKL